MRCSKSSLFCEFKEFFRIFFGCKLLRSAASVSYYLTLSFFPFLICIHFFIISLGINFSSLSGSISLVPKSTISGISSYISYISNVQSPSLLAAAVTILAASLSAALRNLFAGFEGISDTKRFNSAANYFLSFVFSLVFLFVTYLFMVISVAAKTVFLLIDQKLETNLFYVLKFEWLPTAALFCFLILILAAVYRGFFKSVGEKDTILFCSVISASILVIISLIFSGIMEISINYPLVYGSLSFIIIIMIWMYLCSVIILSGGVLIKVLSEKETLLKFNKK